MHSKHERNSVGITSPEADDHLIDNVPILHCTHTNVHSYQVASPKRTFLPDLIHVSPQSHYYGDSIATLGKAFVVDRLRCTPTHVFTRLTGSCRGLAEVDWFEYHTVGNVWPLQRTDELSIYQAIFLLRLTGHVEIIVVCAWYSWPLVARIESWTHRIARSWGFVTHSHTMLRSSWRTSQNVLCVFVIIFIETERVVIASSTNGIQKMSYAILVHLLFSFALIG